jgi:hypothetical protein
VLVERTSIWVRARGLTDSHAGATGCAEAKMYERIVSSKRQREERGERRQRRPVIGGRKMRMRRNLRVHVYVYKRTIWAGPSLTCFIEADLGPL